LSSFWCYAYTVYVRNQKGFVQIIIPIILALSVLAGIGYFALKDSYKPFHSNQTETPIPTTLPQLETTELEKIALLHTTKLDYIPQLNLPSGIEKAQLRSPQKIDNFYFVNFLKSNMNFSINSPVKHSGVLYANESDTEWKIFYEIKELSNDSNNPYDLWKEGAMFYTVIIDTNGGGSGEGQGKLVKINQQSQDWEIIDCFYYSPGSYISHLNSLPKNTPLSRGVITYDKPYPDSVTDFGKYIFDSARNKFTIDNQVKDQSHSNYPLIS
jgi:hypothetical protein